MSSEESFPVHVGEPFPDPGLAHTPGSQWVPENNMLLLGQPGLTEKEIDSWGELTRVHFIPYRSQIVVFLQYLKPGMAIEVPGCRAVDAPMPDWVDPGSTERHLFFRQVFVDSTTGVVIKIRAFTTSPHVTTAVIKEALTRWAEPVTPEQAVQDYRNFQRRYPSSKEIRAAALVSCRPGE